MSLEALYLWVTAHPQAAGFAVFLVALIESLAIVGLFVPGVAMMFAAGALVGAHALPFGPICAAAIAGAIVGDGLSFWLGWRYRERLRTSWVFARYPELMARGENYCRRYGGRSIFLGRFIGPIRAVIPLVAGMLAMPVRRYLCFNVISAGLWGPAYLLPGVAFGASLEIASKVAGQLVTLLVLMLACLWFTTWASQHLYRYFQPRAHRLILATFDLCKQYPLLGRITAPLIDPNQRDYAGLLIWAALLGGIGLTAGLWLSPTWLPLSLRGIGNPYAEYWLSIAASLGDADFYALTLIATAVWLWLRNHNLALAHWLIALGLILVLGELLERAPVRSAVLDFPVLRGVVAYGFLAVLLADQVATYRHWLFYTAAASLAVLIAFARLYLGDASLLSVLFSISIAVMWLILVGVAYRRHRDQRVRIAGLPWVVLAVLLIGVVAESRKHAVAEFEERPEIHSIAQSAWLERGWRELPEYRTQMFGRPREAFAIQWAGALDEIRRSLSTSDWKDANPLTALSALNWLNPIPGLGELPMLPHFNGNSVDRLRMVQRRGEDGRWMILRLWPSSRRLSEGGVPIWLGHIAYLHQNSPLGILRIPTQEESGEQPVEALLEELRALPLPPDQVRKCDDRRCIWAIVQK